MDAQNALLALHSLKGFGAQTYHRLVSQHPEALPSPAHVVAGLLSGTAKARLSAQALADLAGFLQKRGALYDRVQLCIQWAQKTNHHLVYLGESDYPKQLTQISDPPLVLFVRGERSLLHNTGIAIVGSRRCLESSAHFAYEWSKTLSQHGLNIISGLALGVDAYAHRGALHGSGKTLAVLGCGIDQIYPKSHRALYTNIAESGLIVSEYGPGVRAHPALFPKRNRIVSGLACAVLVIEAKLKSGSLITARLAAEQGREVMALPGALNVGHHSGCHKLIGDGAALVECVEDVLASIPDYLKVTENDFAIVVTKQKANNTVPSNLTQVQKTVFASLSDTAKSLDELVAKLQVPADEVATAVIELELEGVVRQSSTGYMVV